MLAAADAGEPTAQAAVDHIGRWLGIGLAGLVNIFDPRIIVLGGRFARLAPYVSAMVEAELDRHALAAPRDLVRVVPADARRSRRRCSAPPSWPWSRSWQIPPPGWAPVPGTPSEIGTSPTNGDWRVVA